MKTLRNSLIALAVLVFGGICLSFTESTTSAEEYSSKLEEFRVEVLSIMDEVQHKHADKIVGKISPAIDKVQTLYDEIAGESKSVVLEKVAESLTTLSVTFSDLANGMFKTILADRARNLKDIEELKDEVVEVQKEIETSIDELKAEKAEAERQLNGAEGTEAEKLEKLVHHYESRINSLNHTNDKFLKFIEMLDKAIVNVKENNDSLDLLFYTLGLNAAVWDDAADAARVAKVYADIEDELVAIDDFSDVIGELEYSWDMLDAINDDLSSFDTNS